MSQQPEIRLTMILGHRELKQFQRVENGRLVFYGYSIDYDENGNETGRTEPTATGSVFWDDGSPFTGRDYDSLMNGGQPKRGFWSRLFGRRLFS